MRLRKIDAMFKNESGVKWGYIEEFAARATLNQLSGEVTRFFDDAIKMAKNVSKGNLGELFFNSARFTVECEG